MATRLCQTCGHEYKTYGRGSKSNIPIKNCGHCIRRFPDEIINNILFEEGFKMNNDKCNCNACKNGRATYHYLVGDPTLDF